MGILLNIDYNSQRDNKDFNGKFKAYWQCFSTSAWMFMSYFCNEIIAKDDDELAKYLDDIEFSIGLSGIGEQIKRKYNWIKGRTSLWWLVQKAGIEKWLNAREIKGKITFHDCDLNYDILNSVINTYGPVIIGTNKIGKLSGGHIILLIGFDENGKICHDPFGDAKMNYKNIEGKNVQYTDEYLKKYTGKKVRCMYWSK